MFLTLGNFPFAQFCARTEKKSDAGQDPDSDEQDSFRSGLHVSSYADLSQS